MRRLIAMITLLLLSFAVAVPAAAKRSAGDLDLSFGERGKVVKAVDLEPEAWDSALTGMARLSRNVTVVLVGNTLLAFRPDGRPARSFGGGRVEIAPPRPGVIQLSGITAVPGGIVVAGSYESPYASQPWDSVGAKAFLARYLSNGTIDPSFGHNGILLSDFGFPPPTESSYPQDKWIAPRVGLAGVAIDPLGHLVLTGRRMTSIGSCKAFGRFFYYEHFVARLQATGEPDPTFAEGGVARLPASGEVGKPLVTKGGGIYLAGLNDHTCFPPYSFLLSRLESSGAPAAEFGDGGVLRLYSESIAGPPVPAWDRSGRLLLLGSGSAASPSGILLYRVLPNGQLDPSFGHEGRITLATSDNFSPAAIAVDNHGRILFAGGSSPLVSEAPTCSFLVARLTASGRLDRRFGGDGTVRTWFGRRSMARATSMKLMPNGRILVAGPLSRPSLGGGEGLAIAAYLNR